MGLGVNSLFDQLLRQGDFVAVDSGRLIIRPASGELLTKCWIKQNRPNLLKDLARLSDEVIFEYSQFSVGRYRSGEILKPGVTLSYCDVLSGQSYRMCFNAEITYARATAKAKKGQDLPKGHFRVKRRSALISYWEKVGFTLPRRLSELHEHLGKLGEVLISAETKNGVALNKASCRPLELSHDYLLGCLILPNDVGKCSAIPRHGVDICSATPRQKNSASNSIQPRPDATYTPNSMRGQKSANNEQRNQGRGSSEVYPCPTPQDIDQWESVAFRRPDQSIDDYLDEHLRATMENKTLDWKGFE